MKKGANNENTSLALSYLQSQIRGKVRSDIVSKIIFSTDASAYKENPIGLVIPNDEEDLKTIITFAKDEKITLIPRAAGTSLAGQVVGCGLVVDMSANFNKIIEINEKESWVKVQPGVILDELNRELAKKGLFFGPETSTSSRCNLGGMLGNNSCGAHSLIYGSTRDHILEVSGYLSDGSKVVFNSLKNEDFFEKLKQNDLEGQIYRRINDILSDAKNRKQIETEFPDKKIRRRNCGYAIDILANMQPFNLNGELFNMAKLIAGSEGTLVIVTEMKLNIVSLPPKNKALVCIHCKSLQESFAANLIALKHSPRSVELMDKTILDLTKENINQNKNRFFVNGDPAAILIVEFAEDSNELLEKKIVDIEADMRRNSFGYDFPVVRGENIPKVWALRKAGLGVLSNMPGDQKPVPVIEDTAVNPEVLPDYMTEFQNLLNKYNLSCVYYAHIATGELHLRPILNLKDPKDIELFHTIALETAKLVKKYNGSLSGEHGDGRLRGEFIPIMIGAENYKLICEIKHTWDPDNIFNANKIIDTPKMNTSLRYENGEKTKDVNTFYRYEKTQGFVRAIEKCNGSGDCKKPYTANGGMCPSYQATLNEQNSTRARANILREYVKNNEKNNPFDHKEIYDILDECLCCKLCKSECPSSIDMAKIKTEFLQHWYENHAIPIRTLAIANIDSISRIAMSVPFIYNMFAKSKMLSFPIKKILGFATDRSLPTLHKYSLRKWAKKNLTQMNALSGQNGTVNIFVDEFTNLNDTVIGIKAISLLCALGYKVVLPKHKQSARTYISKGLLKKAKKIIDSNISVLVDSVSEDNPLLGIEPSAILGFQDEYPELCDVKLINKAKYLAENSFLIEEFIVAEYKKGKIMQEQFTNDVKNILYHGHCQQKALKGTTQTIEMLSIPQNYKVEEIKSGCCGMAGSFGFEKEHYKLSMKVGEMVLLPAVRKAPKNTIISASGTSCRHQIKDGTDKKAVHPIEILWDALKK